MSSAFSNSDSNPDVLSGFSLTSPGFTVSRHKSGHRTRIAQRPADLSAVPLAKAEPYRPIAEIVEELKVIEAEAREPDKALKEILQKIGI